MQILYLTSVLPNNRTTGGEIASFQCIKALRARNKVHVIAYKRANEPVDKVEDDYVVNERVIESQTSKKFSAIWMVLAFLNKRAFSSQKFYSKEYVNLVERMLLNNNYDIVVIDHSQLSWLLDTIPKKMPLIFNSQNVEYLLYKELEQKTRSFLMRLIYNRESKLMREEEKRILKASRQVWVLSQSDMRGFEKLEIEFNACVISIPGGFEILLENEVKYDIGLLGTWTWESNKKGLDWFLEKVLPLIDEKHSVAIGGKGSSSYSLKFRNTNTLGFVKNAQSFLSSCKVIVVPVIAGGGIQIKTLDAISTNRPVVVTSIGVRGIEDLPRSLFVCDDPHQFADKINSLLSANKVEKGGYDWSVNRANRFTNHLNDLLEMCSENI